MLTEFKCGDHVKNTLTGIHGIVIARGDYYGKEPNEYLVEYKPTSNGGVMRGWINAKNIERTVK